MIERKISFAEKIYDLFGESLSRKWKDELHKLNEAIDGTWEFMRSVGITETCRRCALETGSCCKRWVEDVYDETTLVINLLLGVDLPKERYRDDLCFFCGENGCRLRAREGACVTYLCDKIDVDRVKFNRVASIELGYLSLLKVKIRRFVDQRVPRSSLR